MSSFSKLDLNSPIKPEDKKKIYRVNSKDKQSFTQTITPKKWSEMYENGA